MGMIFWQRFVFVSALLTALSSFAGAQPQGSSTRFGGLATLPAELVGTDFYYDRRDLGYFQR